MRKHSFAWLVVAAALAGCAGNPGPGEPGYPYNVTGLYSGTLSVEGQGFRFEVRLSTEAGGGVSGSYAITQPIQLRGDIEGTLTGEYLALRIEYSNNPMTGCDGQLAGTLTVAEGGGMLTGPMTVTDCGDVLAATARLERDEQVR